MYTLFSQGYINPCVYLLSFPSSTYSPCLPPPLPPPTALLSSFRQPPKDWMLLLVIGAMVVVDAVFFVIVTAVDSSRFYAVEQSTAVGP